VFFGKVSVTKKDDDDGKETVFDPPSMGRSEEEAGQWVNKTTRTPYQCFALNFPI
jgi:hypothetical protein